MPDINIEVSPGTSKLLLTAGKWCNDDIVISAPAGKASGPAPVVKSDPNAFTFELDPGGSKRLLTAGKYCERNILVTATGEKPAVTLDISQGSIVITETGYKVGEGTETSWGADNPNRELTITGSAVAGDDIFVATNMIDIQGGNPTIVLEDVTIIMNTSSNNSAADRFRPPVVVRDGQAATIKLVGINTLAGGDQAPGIQIDKDATLTIEGEGGLNSTGRNNTSGIGAGRTSKYGNPDKGNLIIKGGTINAKGSRESGSIGSSRTIAFASIDIQGGVITTSGSYDCLRATSVIISGGTLLGLHTSISSNPEKISHLSITGGNIGNRYTGDVPGRTRTKLSFVTADGLPIADTEIFVSEGDHEWSALTDEEGLIYTYLASDTTVIQVGLSYEEKVDVVISNGEGIFTQ